MKTTKMILMTLILGMGLSTMAIAEKVACSKVPTFKKCWQEQVKEAQTAHPGVMVKIDEYIQGCVNKLNCSLTTDPTQKGEKA